MEAVLSLRSVSSPVKKLWRQKGSVGVGGICDLWNSLLK